MTKKMPVSVGLTLRVLRVEKGLTQKQLAKELNLIEGLPAPDGKVGVKPIQQAEQGRGHQYWLLERVASWSGLSTGLVYVISRVASELRDGDVDTAEDISTALKGLAAAIDMTISGKATLVEHPLLVESVLENYIRELPEDHKLEPGRRYTESSQRVDDARTVTIIANILAKCPRLSTSSKPKPKRSKTK
jgi:transcriptional regulator with XRE-family HTH domain